MESTGLGLSDDPFRVVADPQVCFTGGGFGSARKDLTEALLSGARVCVLTGPPGTGKTALLRAVAADLEAEGVAATLTQCHRWREADELAPDLETPAQLHAGVLLLDEAQTLEPDELSATLRQAVARGFAVLLAGLPELEDIALANLPRVVVPEDVPVRHLRPLSEPEVAAFIANRLQADDGASAPLFTPAAIADIASRSGGVPWLINRLCSTALFMATLAGTDRVDADIVAQACEQLDVSPTVLTARPPPPPAVEAEPAPPPPMPESEALSADRMVPVSRRQRRHRRRWTAAAGTIGGLAAAFLLAVVLSDHPRGTNLPAVSPPPRSDAVAAVPVAPRPEPAPPQPGRDAAAPAATPPPAAAQPDAPPAPEAPPASPRPEPETAASASPAPPAPAVAATPEPVDATDPSQAAVAPLPVSIPATPSQPEVASLPSAAKAPQPRLEDQPASVASPPVPADPPEPRVASEPPAAKRDADETGAQAARSTPAFNLDRIAARLAPTRATMAARSTPPAVTARRPTGPSLTAGALRDLDALRRELDAGADPSVSLAGGSTPLAAAAANGDSQVVRLLLAAGAEPNVRSASGTTPLIEAAQRGDIGSVGALIAAGARPNLAGIDGVTPLMAAARGGHLEVVKLLLRTGAYVDAQAADGWTALMHAVWHEHWPVVDQIVKSGANPQLMNAEGRTAAMLVDQRKFSGMTSSSAPADRAATQ